MVKKEGDRQNFKVAALHMGTDQKAEILVRTRNGYNLQRPILVTYFCQIGPHIEGSITAGHGGTCL